MQEADMLQVMGGRGVTAEDSEHRHARVERFVAERFHAVGLTPREKVIVALILQGCSNKEIAQHCSIGVQTVKDHLKNVYKKSGAHHRTALIAQLLGTARP